MLGENQPVVILRDWRKMLRPLAQGLAFGWRSAFSAAIDCPALRAASAGGIEGSHALEFTPTTVKKKRKARISNGDITTTTPLEVAKCFSRFCGTEAAALIEFAVALPLLVVLVVGIFDFGGAFNLKQELNNAAREGARFGAAQPTNDLALGQPPSVNAVRYLVDSYLQTAHINDCGLNSDSTTTWAFAGGNLDWHFSATGNGCSMTLDVSRGVPVPAILVVGQPTVNLMATTVSISYPYQWHFNSVIQLLVPGANYSFSNLTSDATSVNMD